MADTTVKTHRAAEMADVAELVRGEVLRVCPLMDDDTLDYALGWFDDADNLADGSAEALTDFLGPLLLDAGGEEDDVEELCMRLAAQIFADDQPKSTGLAKLKEAYTAMDSDFTSSTLDLASSIVTDITWASGKGRKAPISSVDMLKLKQQEERQKQKKQGKKGEAVWDPSAVPPIIVTQPNRPPAVAQSKDIQLENFDISYGGHVILKDASVSLSFGRRYGLVGRNGIGKTTLLRAISTRELYVSDNISVLHVEQEVCFSAGIGPFWAAGLQWQPCDCMWH